MAKILYIIGRNKRRSADTRVRSAVKIFPSKIGSRPGRTVEGVRG